MRPKILLLCFIAVTARALAAEWITDVSALYFTDAKEGGVSAGFGTRTPTNHYFGVDFLYYQDSATETESGITASAKLKIYATGVTYKYFAQISAPKQVFLYFGGGVGLAHTTLKATVSGLSLNSQPGVFGSYSFSDSSNNDFAYQLLAGFTFPLAQKASLKLGWRYVRVTDVEFKSLGIPTDDVDSHAVEGGISFRF